jgi:hypothetical protein
MGKTSMWLKLEGRELKLMEELDQRYFQFVDSLPRPLQELALNKKTFEGQPLEKTFLGLSEMNPLITCPAWLFWNIFEIVEDILFLHIAEAGAFFGLASVLMDQLVDGQTQTPGQVALLHQVFYEYGVQGFQDVLPTDSSFWCEFDRLSIEHVQGLATEIMVQTEFQKLDHDAFLKIAHCKVVPMIVSLVALAYVSDQVDVLEPIETSLKHAIVAGQLHDDIGDWYEDVVSNHMTYFITRISEPGKWENPEWPSTEELQRQLDRNWVDIDELKQVRSWLDRSIESAQTLDCPAWITYLSEYKKRADESLELNLGQHLLKAIKPILGS